MRRRSIPCWPCRPRARPEATSPSVRDLERPLQIADGLAAVVNARAPDLDKSERGMEGIRRRIGRGEIDLAGDLRMAAAMSFIEQAAVEQPRKPQSARPSRDDDPVDIDEAPIVVAEPQEIGGCRRMRPDRAREKASRHPMRRARNDCATSCSSRAGSSQDSSCAWLLLSARIAAASGVACATSSAVMVCTIESVMCTGQKICGLSASRGQTRISEIQCAATRAAARTKSVYAHGLQFVAPGIGHRGLAAVGEQDRRAVRGM